MESVRRQLPPLASPPALLCGFQQSQLLGTWPPTLAGEQAQGLVQANKGGYSVLATAGPPTDLAFALPSGLRSTSPLGTMGDPSWKWVKAFAVELRPQLGRDG